VWRGLGWPAHTQQRAQHCSREDAGSVAVSVPSSPVFSRQSQSDRGGGGGLGGGGGGGGRYLPQCVSLACELSTDARKSLSSPATLTRRAARGEEDAIGRRFGVACRAAHARELLRLARREVVQLVVVVVEVEEEVHLNKYRL
jgi:hypothetical protein